MGLYDNAWPHVYEEIRRFYPVWYREVLEMDALWRAQGVELDGVRSAIERMIFNGYIHTADAETITKYENFLNITPEPGAALEERRAQVAAIMFPSPHIGAPEIKFIVGAFTDGTVNVELIQGTIHIRIARKTEAPFRLSCCFPILQKRIPAHLALCFLETIPERTTAIHIGGAVSSVSTLPVPEAADNLKWLDKLRMGGTMAIHSVLPVPEKI